MLQPIDNTDLSTYSIQLLQKHDIFTIRDFMDADLAKLSKILHISEEKSEQVKRELLRRFGPKQLRLGSEYARHRNQFVKYETGIKSLDEMLLKENVPLAAGTIWEINGRVGIGKTLLLYTVALNFVCQYKEATAIFIDTKQDFSATKIREILRKRGIEKAHSGYAMQALKVCFIDTPKSLLELLKSLLKDLDSGDIEVSNIKLLIIDSLPALWLHYRSDEERKESKATLTKLAMLIRRLSTKHFITVIFGNLTLNFEDQMELEELPQISDEFESLNDFTYSQLASKNALKERPMLGRYWSSKADISFCLKLPQDYDQMSENDLTQRSITMLKSKESAAGIDCLIRWTDKGFV